MRKLWRTTHTVDDPRQVCRHVIELLSSFDHFCDVFTRKTAIAFSVFLRKNCLLNLWWETWMARMQQTKCFACWSGSCGWRSTVHYIWPIKLNSQFIFGTKYYVLEESGYCQSFTGTWFDSVDKNRIHHSLDISTWCTVCSVCAMCCMRHRRTPSKANTTNTIKMKSVSWTKRTDKHTPVAKHSSPRSRWMENAIIYTYSRILCTGRSDLKMKHKLGVSISPSERSFEIPTSNASSLQLAAH